jgi:tRNA pseudouridine38-40 synthase
MREPERWVRALNAALPPELRVLRVTRAPEDFHARFSAVGKIYRYASWYAPVLPPHLHKRAWHLYGPLDRAILHSMPSLIEGTHDFRGFCADSGDLPADTVRTLHCVTFRERGSSLSFTLEGNGFLYRMVRMLVGGIVRVAQGKDSLSSFQARLAAGKPWPTPAMAPAEGLTLQKVLYKIPSSQKFQLDSLSKPTSA